MTMPATSLPQGVWRARFPVPITRHTRRCGRRWVTLQAAHNGATWELSATSLGVIGLSLRIPGLDQDFWSVFDFPSTVSTNSALMWMTI